MAVHIKNVGKVVTALIRKRSEREITKNLPKFKRDIDDAVARWRTRWRERLNRPAIYHIENGIRVYDKNISEYPKRRTGKLRDTVGENAKVRWRIRTKEFRKAHGKNVVIFSVTGLFSRRSAKGIRDVGKFLNEMKEPNGNLKPFAGWRNRALSEFNDLITKRRR